MKTKTIVFGLSGMMLIILIYNVSAAVPILKLNVTLSWDDGTTYASGSQQIVWYCEVWDVYYTYGSSLQTWGHTWSLADVGYQNFSVRVNRTAGGYQNQVDNIQGRIYYVFPELLVNFVDPTPANNTEIGSTFRVNITTSTNTTWAVVEHNASSVFVNYSMTRTESFGEGEDESDKWSYINYSIVNKTRIQFKAYSGDISTNVTETRSVIVNNHPPVISLDIPVDSYLTHNRYIDIRFNITDPDSDQINNYTVKILESTGKPGYANPSIHYPSIFNSTINYNFTGLPLDNATNGLYALYHLGQNPLYGESINSVHDYTGNIGDQVTAGSSVITPVFGKFGAGYNITGESGYSPPITLGIGTDFNKTCDLGGGNYGCTFSAWINKRTEIGTTIMSRHDTSPGRYYFLMNAQPYLRFYLYEKGTLYNPHCEIVSQSKGNITLNEWHHVAAGYNGTNLWIYQDGNITNTTACTIRPSEVNWSDQGLPAFFVRTAIGAQGYMTPNFGGFFQGVISEVAFFNKSLTEIELQNLYALPDGKYFWNASATNSDLTSSSMTRNITVCGYPITSQQDWNINCTLCQNFPYNQSQNIGAYNLNMTGNGMLVFNASVQAKDYKLEGGCDLGLLNGVTIW